MVRRVLSALLVFCLLSGLSARAEESVYQKISDALYSIILRTETADVVLGSGVLFVENSVLLTAQGCCREGTLFAVGNDGEHAVRTVEILENSGLALLALATPSAAKPLIFGTYDIQNLPYLFGVNESGTSGALPIYQVLRGMYHDREAMVISSEEGFLPGAFMVDEEGDLTGMTVARQLEGRAMYVGLDVAEIYTAIFGEGKNTVLTASASWQKGLLAIEWEDEARESGIYCITINGAENKYYSSYHVQVTDRYFELPVPPGHTYYVQVQWAESADQVEDMDWSTVTTVTAPKEQYTDHHLTQTSCLVSAPAGQHLSSVQPAMTDVTAETLMNPKTDVYLQILNTYDVDETFQKTMLVELVGPDQQFYFKQLRYTFSPEYERGDSFVVPVDDLLAECVRFSGGALMQGSYVLRCVLEGKITGEYAFTLEENGKARTEEKLTSGFVDGLSAREENGFVTLTWDASSVPEGAKVTVYHLYDGNVYYNYFSIKEDADRAEWIVAPGYPSVAWAVWSTEEEAPSLVPEKMTDYIVLPAGDAAPLTSHDFTNRRMGIALSTDDGAVEKGIYLPEGTITREMLANPDMHVYFQTEDTYRVDATSPEHALAVVLCTPDEMIFVNTGHYIFDAALQSSDLWLMDITQLFASYASMTEGGEYPSGEYRILYCIDGQIAAEYSFVLE